MHGYYNSLTQIQQQMGQNMAARSKTEKINIQNHSMESASHCSNVHSKEEAKHETSQKTKKMGNLSTSFSKKSTQLTRKANTDTIFKGIAS